MVITSRLAAGRYDVWLQLLAGMKEAVYLLRARSILLI